MKNGKKVAIITTEEIPGQRFSAMFSSSATGIRYRYMLSLEWAAYYVLKNLHGARYANA